MSFPKEIEDVLQDALKQILEKNSNPDSKIDLEAWLFKDGPWEDVDPILILIENYRNVSTDTWKKILDLADNSDAFMSQIGTWLIEICDGFQEDLKTRVIQSIKNNPELSELLEQK